MTRMKIGTLSQTITKTLHPLLQGTDILCNPGFQGRFKTKNQEMEYDHATSDQSIATLFKTA